MNFKLINQFLAKIIGFLTVQNRPSIILILIIAPIILTYTFGIINDKINQKKSKGVLDYLFKVLWLPLLTFLWGEIIFIILKIGFSGIFLMQIKNTNNIPYTILIFSLNTFIFQILSSIDKYIAYRKKLSESFKDIKVPFQLLFRVLRILLILGTVLSILQNLGVDILALIFFGGYYISVLGGLIIINSVLKIIHHKILSIVIKNGHFWIYILIKSLYLPLQFLLVLGTTYICYLISILKWVPPTAVSDIVTKVYSLTLLGLLAWFFFRLAGMFEEQLGLGRLTKKVPSKTTSQATSKLVRVVMVVVLVLAALPIIGIPISGILALSGGSAIVVGIAIRPISENYFGGILIYSDRFFEVGDWIYSPDQNIEGTVEDIGWRSTRIRTFDKRPLYVPNSVFAKISVINASRMSNRRIKETIGIRYKDSNILDQLTQDIQNMLKNHPEIDNKQTLLVHFTEFGPHSLNINLYTFTKTRNWEKYRDVQQDVFLKTIEIIKKNGAELAIPERKLFVNTKVEKSDEN